MDKSTIEVFYQDGSKKSTQVVLPLELLVRLAIGSLIDNTRPAKAVLVHAPSTDLVHVYIADQPDGFEIRRSDNGGVFRTVLKGVK